MPADSYVQVGASAVIGTRLTSAYAERDETYTYCWTESLRNSAESSTQSGFWRELSMTTSQRRPRSASRSPLRSPMSVSSSGNISRPDPRLKSVTVCPRSRA